MSKSVTLGSLVLSDAPICYGILMPGDDTLGGIPVVKVRDYQQNGIEPSRLLRAAPQIEAPFRRSRLAGGDILLSIRGTTGEVAIVPAELTGANITQDTARIRVDAREREYVFQALHAPSLKRQIRLNTIGQAVKGINISSVRQLQVPWPAESVRRSVARTLRSVDATTASLKQLIVTKQKFKRGIEQQLLSGKTRFPEFAAQPWQMSRLGDHVVRIARRNEGATTLVLTASGEHGLVDQRRYFNRSVAGADLSRYYLLKRGEFAYNRSAMKGYPYGATKRLDEHAQGALSTLYLCFAISDERLDPDYLKYVFDSGVLNRQLRPIARVGARAHGLLNVSDEDYLSIVLPLPEISEQRRIAGVVGALDREIDLVDARRTQIELYKRGLLSLLLNSETATP